MLRSVAPEWYSFGRGEHGELGRKVVTEGVDAPGLQNTDVRALAPQLVADETGLPVLEAVVCGHFHCLARTQIGNILAWGANAEGQLGLSGELSDDVFVCAPSRALGSLQDKLRGERIGDFAAGRSHSVFVSEHSGRCFVAGKLPADDPGRRGDGTVEEVRELELVDSNGSKPRGEVVLCSAGETQTLFVTREGEVWSWLGDTPTVAQGTGQLERPLSRAVLGLPKVARIACGWHHSLALTEDARVYAWGIGCFGQLGLGSCKLNPSPAQVSFPEECDGQVIDVAGGFASSFAVTTQGWVFAWGANEKCQLGLGLSIRGATTPKVVQALSSVSVVQIAAGVSHTACVTIDGCLYLWGFGAYGQLGFSFNDAKASATLGQGGCVPLSITGGSVSAAATSTSATAGTSSVGHSRPWVQVWPRRCLRGPFAKHICLEVHCGSYHTVARASSEDLRVSALVQEEVLKPSPLQLTGLPASANMESFDENSVSSLPPGAGLVESPDSSLRPGTSSEKRHTDAFRSLANLFWNTTPHKGRVEVPAPKPSRINFAESGKWHRALANTNLQIRQPYDGFEHPFGNADKSPPDDHAQDQDRLDSQIPLHLSPTWDAVDEALHRAFGNRSVGDPGTYLDLADLVAGVDDSAFASRVSRSEKLSMPKASQEALAPPATPCRGLARVECLTPRPFYLPVVHTEALPAQAATEEQTDTTSGDTANVGDAATQDDAAASVAVGAGSGEDVT